MTKEEIIKKHISGYRGAVKQSDAIKAMKHAEQEAREAFNSSRECVGNKYINGFAEALELCKYESFEIYWKERNNV